MSQRGIEFVEQWVQDNVTLGPYVEEGSADPRPKEYAKQCLLDAEQKGITLDEIDEDVGDLEDYMTEAINSQADDEVNRLAAKDD